MTRSLHASAGGIAPKRCLRAGAGAGNENDPPAHSPSPGSCRLFCDKGGQLRELALSSSLDHTLWAAAMVLSRAFHARVGGQRDACKSVVGGPLTG